MFTESPLLHKLLRSIPERPYCSDDPRRGLHVYDKEIALNLSHIQFNGPTHRKWLIFDVDRPNAAIDWYDASKAAPPPNFTIKNPRNGHAHLIYGLKVPIRTADDGSYAALRYAAHVYNGLRQLLAADVGYTGLIAKNPIHDAWYTVEWRSELYTLNELDDNIPDEAYRRAKKVDDCSGLGRNVMLFDDLRQWAYKTVREYWNNRMAWEQAVFEEGLRVSRTFTNPLNDNEVKAIAKSVAKWTWKRITPTSFAKSQASRGRRKGARKRAIKLAEAISYRQEGHSVSEIAKRLDVSRSTLYGWFKNYPLRSVL